MSTPPAATSKVPRQLLPERPVFRRCVAIITKDVNGQRIVLKSLTLPTLKESFRVREHMFYIDIGKAFMISSKGAYLMYDLDITEPLNLTMKEMKEHKPIELEGTAQYSKGFNMLVQGEVIRQALRSLGQGNQFGLLWMIMMLVVGIALGYFAGVAYPMHPATTGTTTTTISTSTTTSVKMLLGSMGWWV